MVLATFAAGRFWHVEETFRKIAGVTATAVGYMGGTAEDPTPESVSTGETGHLEVLQLQYDPIKVTYLRLLEVYWSCHDATQMGRQGRDVGPQFRSAIFYHSPQQKSLAEHSRSLETGRLRRPIVTLIAPAEKFWIAPEDQQRYYLKHGRGPR